MTNIRASTENRNWSTIWMMKSAGHFILRLKTLCVRCLSLAPWSYKEWPTEPKRPMSKQQAIKTTKTCSVTSQWMKGWLLCRYATTTLLMTSSLPTSTTSEEIKSFSSWMKQKCGRESSTQLLIMQPNSRPCATSIPMKWIYLSRE